MPRRVTSARFAAAIEARRQPFYDDYGSSSFPAALFNGHLTASNFQVRAGAR